MNFLEQIKAATEKETELSLGCVYTRFVIEKEHHERRCSYATFTASP